MISYECPLGAFKHGIKALEAQKSESAAVKIQNDK